MIFFIPYRVNRPFTRWPVLTIGLIVTNVLVYFAAASNLEWVAKNFGFLPNASGLYTWFTGMFLHGDLFFHLGWNMYFLWLFGSVLEDAIGKIRFIIIYLAGGLAADLIHGLIASAFIQGGDRVPLIGASGAIAAVMGVFAVRFYKNEISMAYFAWVFMFLRWGVFEISSVAGLGLWLAREFLSGFLQLGGLPSSVANWAHIGGFLFGVAVAFVFKLAKEADTEYLTDEATTYARGGVHDVAAAKYRQLAENDPNNPDILVQKARSMILSDNGDKRQAAADFKKAIELFMRAGRKPEALQAYQELSGALHDVRLDPKTLLSIGSLSEGVHEYELAVRTYVDLIHQQPDSWEAEKAQFRLAHVYLAMGMSQDAMRVWQEFADRYPGSEWAPFANSTFLSAV